MRKGRGFSLLEVLVAISILAVAILAIASMFPTAYTNVHRSGVDTVTVAAPAGRRVQVTSLRAK